MKKFLELVAEDLLHTYGNNLSRVTLVLPGKRARLFMNQYLARQSEKPVWSPRYQTIDELFLELSPYRKAEQIETICLLYHIYSKLVDNPEPLDEFYAWGEIILSDFDDIDKHLAPAQKVFANVYDMHAIHEDYLTDEQVEALKEFFSNFNRESNTQLKENFLRLWQIMPRLYEGLREELRQRGYLYSGALYREVVEQLGGVPGLHSADAKRQQALAEKLHDRIYAFVGFNVVDECEEALFRLLGEEHTRFYWDYDEMYMQNTKDQSPWEAGLFLRQNLKAFPNRLPREYFDNLQHLKDITFIATNTDNAQARYLPTWIHQQLTPEENETAIVLCDEHQLQPVLHSLPEDTPEHINVTMGFPLTDTPIFSFLSIITSMQIDGWEASGKRFRNTFMEKVQRHPYHALLSSDIFVHQSDNLSLLNYMQAIVTELATHYAQKEEQDDIYDQLYAEALFQTHKILNRFIKITEDGTLDVHAITLRRLLRTVLSTTSIPFHGEPAIGMQVMGLMETRNLDFDHLLMMNVGEGTMPKKSNDNSLIPYNLREAFGLTTIRHRISVFAYYFFRLLQRTSHVTLLYNENSSGVKNNEMSRFMRQLMAETNLPIRHIRLTPKNQPKTDDFEIWADKTPQMLADLRKRYNYKPFAPSAINVYLDCPIKFYFKYIAGLYVKQEEKDEGITAVEMGSFFHDAAENFYKDLAAHYHTQTFSADMLRYALEHKDTQIAKFIDMGQYGNKNGLPMIIYKVILQYLCNLLQFDRNQAPFTIESMEEEYYISLPVEIEGQESFMLKIGGRVDRLDRASDRYIVIDYKTGGKSGEPINMEDIFDHKKENSGYYFQTILYALAVSHHFNHSAVQPTLLYVRKSHEKDYDSSLLLKIKGSESEPIMDVRTLEEDFLQHLTKIMKELFNPHIRFTQTNDENHCKFCEFQKLCGKKIKEY